MIVRVLWKSLKPISGISKIKCVQSHMVQSVQALNFMPTIYWAANWLSASRIYRAHFEEFEVQND